LFVNAIYNPLMINAIRSDDLKMKMYFKKNGENLKVYFHFVFNVLLSMVYVI